MESVPEASSSFLTQTWAHLTVNPMGIVWRYVFALLGGGLAMGVHIFVTFRAGGAPRLGNAISIGLVFGHLVAFLVILADEYPRRLHPLWPGWMRLFISGILGLGIGTLTWATFALLFLQIDSPDWGVLALGGFGLAFGFWVTANFNMPGWLAFLITTIAVYGPIFVAFNNFWNKTGDPPPALLFYDSFTEVYTLGIPFALLVALGGHARAIRRDIQGWLRSRADRRVNPVGEGFE